MVWRSASRPRCAAWLRGAACAALLLGGLAEPARAQSTLLGGRGTLLVPDADTVPPTHFTTSFGASWDGQGRDRFQASPEAVTFGFLPNLDVAAGVESRSPDDPEARGAPQDGLLQLKLRALTESARRPAIALGLGLDHLFHGRDLLPSLIVHKNAGPLLVTGQLGYRLPLRSVTADPAGLFGGLGVAYYPTAALALMVQALGEGGAQRSLSLMPGIAWSLLGPDTTARRRESLRAKARESVAALERELGVPITPISDGGPAAAASGPALPTRNATLSMPGRVTFFVTGGPSIGSGPLGSGPGWRVMVGVQLSTFDEFLQDSDGDGIPDRVDQCPFEPEDWDGYQDEDGCPDHGTEVLRKRALEKIKAGQEETPGLTGPVPRFRLRIPVGEVPGPGAPRRDTAPMYQPAGPGSPSAAPTPAPGGGESPRP